jgi:outer membrane protein TolC
MRIKNIWLSLFFLVLGLNAHADQNALELYITEGLRNNLALKQQEFQFEKSMEVLEEAKGMFLPSIQSLQDYPQTSPMR